MADKPMSETTFERGFLSRWLTARCICGLAINLAMMVIIRLSFAPFGVLLALMNWLCAKTDKY